MYFQRKYGGILVGMIVLVALLTGIVSTVLADSPSCNIKVLGLPEDEPLELAVGDKYTFDVLVTCDTPFILAMALSDAYYPGRGVFWHDVDRATNSSSAILYLTMTGKEPTVDLPAVCDWPEPGDCWPEGVAPVGIVVGVRYQGGLVIAERFPFAVQVVP